MARGLLVVDVQNDFCEGGSLAVEGGAGVAGDVARFVRDHGDEYAMIVATRDWHVDPGTHWSEEPDFHDTWPVHCQAGTKGAAWHPALQPVTDRFDVIVSKGQHEAAYSGFEGRDDEGRPLRDVLAQRGIDAVDIVGLATDHCVHDTAMDALAAGLDVRVRLDLCAGVLPESTGAAIDDMAEAGVDVDASA